MACVLPLERVRIYSRRPEPAAELAATTAERYAWDVSAAASVEDALRDADVVVTTTTAREPIVERAWLAPGTHVNAVGSSIPTTRELDGATHGRARASSSTRASPRSTSPGDILLAMREGTLAEDVALRRARRGADRQRAGTGERRRPDRLRLARRSRSRTSPPPSSPCASPSSAGLGAEVTL